VLSSSTPHGRTGTTPRPPRSSPTLEATADDAHTSYTPWNVGTGFVDALDAVERAEAGEFARFGGIELVDPDT
jgi:serine protease AprX